MTKIKYVDLNSLWLLSGDQEMQAFFDEQTQGYDHIILQDVEEDGMHDLYKQEIVKKWYAYLIDKGFTVSFVLSHRNSKDMYPFPNIAFINGMLIKTYYYQLNRHINQRPTEWNNNGVALFLPGKTKFYTRSRLMYELHKANITENMEWSYIVPEEAREIIKERYFTDLSGDEFNTFIKECTRSIDVDYDKQGVLGMINDDMCMLEGCYNVAPDIYNNTGFTIISETWYAGGTIPIITEKTFRTMMNCHPFILLGAKGALRMLKEFGFKTFESYLVNPDYNELEREEDRLLAVVENVKYFQENYLRFEDEIRKDVEHNYHLVMDLAKQHIAAIEQTLPSPYEFDPHLYEFYCFWR